MILAKTREEYNSLMNTLEATVGPIAFDTETPAFGDPEDIRPWTLPITGAGFWTPEVCGYVRGELLDDRFQKMLNERVIIAHNAQFDMSVVEGRGFDVSKTVCHDTLITAKLANENRFSYSLKELAKSVLRVDSVTLFEDLGERPADESSPEFAAWEEKLAAYCLKDVEYTYSLFVHFEEKLKEDGLWKLYDELERPLVDVLRRMTRRGIKVDVGYLQIMQVKLKDEIEKIEREARDFLRKEFNDDSLEPNIGSTKQLSGYFYGIKKYKIPDDFKTPKGLPSTNMEALEYIAENYQCPLASLVLKHREYSKLLGTYAEGLLKRRDEGDVIHPSFRQLGAKTGRLSSANPNAQNIGRRADEFDIRAAFIPREGYVFVDGDFSQIEPRLVAFLSGDPQMLKAYEDGADLHQIVADAVGCDRQTGKTMGLAILYGMSSYSLGRKLGISKEAAQNLISGYFSKFPRIYDFIEKAKKTMRTTYAVKSILGRKRRFPEYPAAQSAGDDKAVSRVERMAVNAIVQSSAADIMKIALRNMPAALAPYGSHLLMTVHDEVVVEVPQEHAEAVKAVVKEVMEGAISLGTIRMKVSPVVMPTHWGK